ncbi:MAG: hypothetical protein U9R16_00340 [Campylobacterota bacterium]|nr:hypothetical protein [Campylobacterota bacterium]
MKKIFFSLLAVSTLFSQQLIKIKSSDNLSLTIYNNNLAMINEKRTFDIKKDGLQKLVYEGIASSVISESIIPYFSEQTTLYSQNYHYDILSLNKLLEKHINREIIYKEKVNDYKYKRERAVLLSLNPILLEKKGEIISGISPNQIIFTSLPDDLITKPSLVWNTDSKKGKQNIELNYLTKNISWRSDYILNIDKSNSLNGWITIKNNSGVQYKNANIYCIAGDVNTNTQEIRENYKAMAYRTMAKSPQVIEKSFAGYHLYKIPFKETLNNNEKKQINFINKQNIKINSKATTKNAIFLHRFSKIKEQNFSNIIELNNSKQSGLGIPLPKGIVRVYKKDGKISHFIGQSRIKHTSNNQKISLKIGKFFDIKQDIKQKYYKNTREYIRTKYSRLIKNKTDKKRTIEIIESNYSNNIKNIININNCKDNCTSIQDGLSQFKYIIELKPNSTYNLVVDYKLEYSIPLK